MGPFLLALGVSSTAWLSPPIVGGEVVPAGQDRAVANLGNCTGTLIAPRVVLTAAHCVRAHGSEVTFEGEALAFRIVDAVVDRRWNELSTGYDVGLLLLDRAPAIAPVEINRRNLREVIAPGEPLRAVGFGITGSGLNDFGTKRQVTFALRGIATEVLTFGDADENICFGDSGGPQFASIDGREVQVGITSYTRFIGGGYCHSGSGSQRVDRAIPFIDAWLATWSAACPFDGRCDAGCSGLDPDCDGCVANDRCEPDCPQRDVDCADGWPSGSPCEADADCDSHICIQAPDDSRYRYCARNCDLGYPESCVVAQGETCESFPGGAGCVYATPSPGRQGASCELNSDCHLDHCIDGVCVSPCDEGEACPLGSTCDTAAAVPYCVNQECAIAPRGSRGGSIWSIMTMLFALAVGRRLCARRVRRQPR